MDYCIKTLKSIEKISKAYKTISHVKKGLSIFLIFYTIFKFIAYYVKQ